MTDKILEALEIGLSAMNEIAEEYKGCDPKIQILLKEDVRKIEEGIALHKSSKASLLSDEEILKTWTAKTEIEFPGDGAYPVWISSTDVLEFTQALFEKVTK